MATDRPSPPVSRRKKLKPWEKALICASVLTSLALAALLGFRVLTYYTGPLYDEWHCGQGEAPAVQKEGGSACYPEGAKLPAGYTWDPLGNRPFSCDRRHGWEPIEHQRTGERDCMRRTDPLALPPRGWAYVNYVIRAG